MIEDPSRKKIPRVAYLGPETTFTHQAAMHFFEDGANFRAAETIDDVFHLVETGSCDQGVVPIENTYEGSVSRTLDLFYEYDLKISAEIINRIHHNLLSKSKRLENIKVLYSHPMAIAQCRLWIKSTLNGVGIAEVGSTARAAKKAVEDPEAAAIGSIMAAEVYGLNVLQENIEDVADNFTRFMVIGKDQAVPTGRDKTSILISLMHQPGTLYRALETLARRNINMTRIESRPLKMGQWEYLFFMDLDGHEQDRSLGEALREMQGHCVFLKRLGSYPRAM